MKPAPSPDNPLLSLVINILLPVLILIKGARFLDPQPLLALALCFPLVYGVQDYIRRRHKNYVSLMGVVHVLLTGSLAILKLNGIWFAIKDASLPLILGVLVLGSAWTLNPAAKLLFCNPHVLNMALIDERLSQYNKGTEFSASLKRTTLWLSLSFFFSAVANFFLAYRIFEAIDPALSQDETMRILNTQIAHMAWVGTLVIALPLMVFSSILIYVFLKRLSRLVDVPIDALMKT